MEERNEETTAAVREDVLTTDGAGAGGERETTDARRSVRTDITVRRRMAVLNATCPNCGVTGARKQYIRRTQTMKGNLLRLKCEACNYSWKIVVK